MISDDIIIDASKSRGGLNLRELWRYRDLLYVLARRDISVRYRQTVLGALWAILQPLLTMLVFSLIFGRLARIPSDGMPYPLFAFAGLLPWLFFASAMNSIGGSVVGASSLITKVYFPRLIIPAAAIGAPFVDLLISSAFMFLLMFHYGVLPSFTVLWLLPLFALTALVAIGVGSLIAALTVSYRDFRHIMQPLIMFWMLLTPVIYPPTFVPEPWRWVLLINPMAGIVGAIRSAWFGQPFDLQALGCSMALTLVLLWVGISYFRSVERRFADII